MPDLMDTYIENRKMIQPNHANDLDTTHGGNVLKWMDEVGAMSAIRFAGSDVLTARMEQTNFRGPIPVGENALIESYVYETGTTSMRVRVRTFREDLRSPETELTTESHLVYVAIDEGFEPRSVPELTVDSERGEELLEAARASDENNDHDE
ncbi:acyl-CoA thioesterase [Halorientalis regularis]|jgi:acyl-CoA hydrolase|uniref:Acyl-CoA hydrolase n=1 Tax=Halorientalis regularis TaxID=660518 RepID=A0A1G7FXE2_9EURY|nr:acyl-CoA thioesterase [Halorientalis regularis]SDE80553.1 Acyl-CoA hydrolase [Halorientalis regularis]